MTNEELPYPKWSEPATKGDLIRTVLALDASILSLSLAVAQAKAGKFAEADRLLADIAKRSEAIGKVVDDLAGRVTDGD